MKSVDIDHVIFGVAGSGGWQKVGFRLTRQIIQYTRAVGYGVYDRLKEQTAKGIQGNGVGAGTLEVL